MFPILRSQAARYLSMPLIVFSASAFLFAGIAVAQALLPAGWEALPAAEFVDAAAPVWGASETDSETRSAIGARSVELLNSMATTPGSIDYSVVSSLLRMASEQLTEELRGNIQQLISDQDDGATSYLSVRQRIGALYLSGASYAERTQELADWVVAAGATDFAEVWVEEWPWIYNQLSYPHLSPGGVRIRWTGFVAAPNTGDFVFSISPININASYGPYDMRHSMSVSVNGQRLLNADHENWTAEGSPVRLVQGEAAELTVEANFNCYKPPVGVMHAMLYWQGPGISKSLVPRSALSVVEGGEQGLRGEYELVVSDGFRNVTRVDPGIDFCWATGRRVAPEHSAQISKVTEAMLAKATSSSYLDECEQSLDTDSPKEHPLLHEPGLLAECLSTEQRSQFMQELLTRPALLRSLSFSGVYEFFRSFRMGSPDLALDVFGQWCLLQRDYSCALASEATMSAFFMENRYGARHLAIVIGDQYPPQQERLHDEFLSNTDGRCNLAAAYVLAYCYQMRGAIDEWIEELDEVLSSPTVIGDVRVNWLLARAHAEEVKAKPSDPYEVAAERLLAGRAWIEEASLHAETEAVQIRVLQEVVARLTAGGALVEAERVLDAQAGDLSSPQASLVAAELRSTLHQLSAGREAQKTDQQAQARDSYLAELRRRRQKAAEQGRAASANRYADLINTIEDE